MISGTALIGNAEKNQDTIGNLEELDAAFSEVEKRIKEKSPELYRQIFALRGGSIIAGISSLFLEYPSGRITNDFTSTKQLGSLNDDTLANVWIKNKESRVQQAKNYKERIDDLGS